MSARYEGNQHESIIVDGASHIRIHYASFLQFTTTTIICLNFNRFWSTHNYFDFCSSSEDGVCTSIVPGTGSITYIDSICARDISNPSGSGARGQYFFHQNQMINSTVKVRLFSGTNGKNGYNNFIVLGGEPSVKDVNISKTEKEFRTVVAFGSFQMKEATVTRLTCINNTVSWGDTLRSGDILEGGLSISMSNFVFNVSPLSVMTILKHSLNGTSMTAMKNKAPVFLYSGNQIPRSVRLQMIFSDIILVNQSEISCVLNDNDENYSGATLALPDLICQAETRTAKSRFMTKVGFMLFLV